MLKRIASVAGVVLMTSSFALAGQAVTKPAEQPKTAASQNSESANATKVKKHHKKHKKHHKKTITPAPAQK